MNNKFIFKIKIFFTKFSLVFVILSINSLLLLMLDDLDDILWDDSSFVLFLVAFSLLGVITSSIIIINKIIFSRNLYKSWSKMFKFKLFRVGLIFFVSLLIVSIIFYFGIAIGVMYLSGDDEDFADSMAAIEKSESETQSDEKIFVSSGEDFVIEDDSGQTKFLIKIVATKWIEKFWQRDWHYRTESTEETVKELFPNKKFFIVRISAKNIGDMPGFLRLDLDNRKWEPEQKFFLTDHGGRKYINAYGGADDVFDINDVNFGLPKNSIDYYEQNPNEEGFENIVFDVDPDLEGLKLLFRNHEIEL